MLELTHGETDEKIIVTLNELITLVAPNFLFIFTNSTTKEQVAFVKLESDDESSYPSRYNQFSINTAVTFLNKTIGEWLYSVYEQASAVNTDPDLATGEVENGKMLLYPAAADIYEPEMYNKATTYKTYNG